MFIPRQRRRYFAWLLCAAMLMTALMPAFSRTFASDGAANAVLLEICSAMGVTYAKSSDSDSKQTGTMNDCPYCRVHFDLPVLPPAPARLPQFKITSERPALFYRSPTPLFSWVVANPRGPPAA
nr:DUF2946 domain-containing protein [uncultured Duganella sp.]